MEDVLVPIVLFVCIAVTTIGFPLARAWARRIDRSNDAPRIPSDVTARLERMEQAIDSIAVEVERISEAQRFTTRLLAERSSSAPAGTPPAIRE